jgi:predicted nuclease of predicted toxin-antitoxin system
MVESVVHLLNGRGHPITRVRDVGLAKEDDQTVIEYAVSRSLVIVTFDIGMLGKATKAACKCLLIRTPERSARTRLAAVYNFVFTALREEDCSRVVVKGDGTAESMDWPWDTGY